MRALAVESVVPAFNVVVGSHHTLKDGPRRWRPAGAVYPGVREVGEQLCQLGVIPGSSLFQLLECLHDVGSGEVGKGHQLSDVASHLWLPEICSV